MRGASVLGAARHAFANVAFYRRVYRREPETLSDIPYVERSDFAAAKGPMDCMMDLDLVIGAVPTQDRGSNRFPLTILESSADWLARQVRLRRALAHLGIDAAPGGLRFLLLADDATGAFAADLSALLSWDRARASIAYLDGDTDGADTALEAWWPDVTLIVTPAMADSDISRLGRCVVVCQAADAARRSADCDRLLTDDACHLLGAARQGEQVFAFDSEDLIVEMEPSTGRPALTTARPRCFPLVRFLLDADVKLAPDR
jgi:hypothetical protein